MKLSLLIPTIGKRKHMLDDLIWDLVKQGVTPNSDEVEVLTDNSETDSIGEKRNRLLQSAKGKYVAFIDDDDKVSGNYLKLLLDGTATNPDCCSLLGIITFDGLKPELFEHSLKYSEWKTNEQAKPDEIKYERNITPLNCIKSEIAKQFKFPESNFGEDHSWSKEINASGLLKSEYYIEQVLYYYQFKPNKK